MALRFYLLPSFTVLFLFGCTSSKNISGDHVHLWQFDKEDFDDVPAVEEKVKLGVVPNMVFVPSSKMQLDQTDPSTKVQIDAFYLSETEVTNYQYAFFLNRCDSVLDKLDQYINLKGENSHIINLNGQYTIEKGYEIHPVVNVSHAGAVIYCKWLSDWQNALSEKNGMLLIPNFRLPSFCEFGSASLGKAPKDTNEIRNYTMGENLEKFAWYSINSADKLQQVRQLKSNKLALYDLKGNAAEWVADTDVRPFNKLDNRSNPYLPSEDSASVCGGAYDSPRSELMYLENTTLHQNTMSPTVGFRVCQTILGRSTGYEF